MLSVQLQIFKFIIFLSQKLVYEKNFQKNYFCAPLFTVKNSNLLNFTGNLDNKV